MEISCRLNLALAKEKLGEFDVVIDQCERILDYESKNGKACFRIGQAMYQ